VITIPEGVDIAGTYCVEARIGAGAFGTVYRVRHRFLGRMALKLVPCGTEEELERLALEGAAHARLSHRNITRVFDVNTTEVGGERVLYIASEYMPVGDLDSYLAQVHRLPLAECAVLADDVLSALSYSHEREAPVFHRDIKPANIFLGGEKEVVFKLGDFGVSAELRNREERITAAAGTVMFQAPECAFGPYLAQSDVYGAAFVLFRALTGTYPYPVGVNSGDSWTQRLKQRPSLPSRFSLDCSRELDEVMIRALSPDPFERYSSPGAFQLAILAVLPKRASARL